LRRKSAERKKRQQAEIDSRRRTIDERTQVHRLNGVWFRVEVAALPAVVMVDEVVDGQPHRRKTAESRFDVVLRRDTSRLINSSDQRLGLYGVREIYAAGKRQLSRQELKAFGLR